MGFDVKGSTALVTGANRGIGRAIAQSLLDHGAARLYAAVRTPSSVEDLVSAHPGRVVAVPFDLSDGAGVRAAARLAADVNLLINNAGVLKAAALLSEDAFESLRYEFDVNVYGLLRAAQAFAPVLRSNGGGAFVQINSVVSVKAFPDFATYCASKAASYSLTQSLRTVLGEGGTHVLSVHPGPIASDMADSAGLTEIAEPPEVVSEGIVVALREGDFHLFPDTMARRVGDAYDGFAKAIVESDLLEG